MLETVIFSIDDGCELRERKRFLKYVDNLIAAGQISYCAQCVGMWLGVLEASYMMKATEWEKYIKGSFYVGGQVCVLLVPADVRQPCTFLYSNGDREVAGVMKEVEADKALCCSGWTYVEETQKYFILEGV